MKTKTILFLSALLLIALAACTPAGTGDTGREPATNDNSDTTTSPPTTEPTETPTEEPTAVPQPDTITIHGEISVGDIAADYILPEDGRLTVQVQDTGRADAPALVLGEQVLTTTPGEPLRYEISVAADAFDAAARVSIAARIEDSAGQLLFINDTAHLVTAEQTAVDVQLVPAQLTIALPEIPIHNQVWQWERWEDSATGEESNDITVPNPDRYTLQLRPDGAYQLQADCNHVAGQYTLDGNSLTLNPGATTEMACGPDSLDTIFLARLFDVVTFVFNENGNLVLNLKMDAGNMIFSRQIVVDKQLEDTRWVLQSIVDGDAVSHTALDAAITAVFSNGQVNGSSGCNNYFASYELDKTMLTLGPIGGTRRACEDERMSREAAFLAALQATTRYQITGDKLNLLDETGAILLTMEAESMTEEKPSTEGDAATAAHEALQNVWQWVRYQDTASGDESNNISVENPAQYTLELLPNGMYRAQADCNLISGGYTLKGNRLTLHPGVTTLAECGPDSLYDTYLDQLGNVATFVFDADGNLILNLQMDGGNMLFTR